jgi:hypothetical protein
MYKNDEIKRNNQIDYCLGRTRMYLENTRQQFKYPFSIGEQHRIKITNKDMHNSLFLEIFRKSLGKYLGYDYVFTFEFPINQFWMICKES